MLVRAYSKRRWRMIRKKTSKKEEKRLGGLGVFVSRVPVYLFLLWVARALYTLDSLFLVFFLSLFHTNRQISGSRRLRKKTKKMKMKTKKKRGAGRRIRKELSSVVVVVLLD
jgi:hypothetical protein